VKNIAVKSIVILLVVLNLAGCDVLNRLFGGHDNKKVCAIQMPYAIHTDKQEWLFSAKENRQFSESVTNALGEHVHRGYYKVSLRKPYGWLRPTICEDSSELGYILGPYDYTNCLMRWAKKSLKQDEYLCPSDSAILLTGANVYRHQTRNMEIETILIRYKDGKILISDRLTSSRQVVIAAEKRQFRKLGRMVGEELAELINDKEKWR